MYPHALPLALEDHLLVASTLADEVEQLTQSLGLLRWHYVSSLPCEVLAILHATDGVVDLPASEARGHLDRLAELLTDAVEVVHKAQEVSLLRGVGSVVLSEARGCLASRQLLEGEILAHSLFAGYLLFISLRTFDERFTKTVYILVSYDAPSAFVEASHTLLYILLRVPWAVLPDTRKLGEQYR